MADRKGQLGNRLDNLPWTTGCPAKAGRNWPGTKAVKTRGTRWPITQLSQRSSKRWPTRQAIYPSCKKPVHPAPVRYLLGVYRANPNRRDSSGVTLLMLSAAAGKLDIHNLLRFHGASPHAVDDAGNSVLSHAVRGGNQEIVEDLVQRCKVDVHVRNKEGQSVFGWAQQERNQPSDIARIIRYGSDALDSEL